MIKKILTLLVFLTASLQANEAPKQPGELAPQDSEDLFSFRTALKKKPSKDEADSLSKNSAAHFLNLANQLERTGQGAANPPEQQPREYIHTMERRMPRQPQPPRRNLFYRLCCCCR